MRDSVVNDGVSVGRASQPSLVAAAAPEAALARGRSGSSFYTAMRILPSVQRDAMFAIYDFCRAVDDIADGPGERAVRIAALDHWRAEIDAVLRQESSGRIAGLGDAMRRFALAREDFMAIVDGVEMDALADIVAPDWATLDLYCDRVASAVGRLSVKVFGLAPADGSELAFHLGRALQLTNILRDLDEDATKGRLYLPREALEEAGIATLGVQGVLAHKAVDRVCLAVVDRAKWHFDRAGAIMARYPLRIVRAPMLMAKAYRMILQRLEQRGFAPPRRPVRTSRGALVWNLLKSGLVRTRI